MISIFEVELGSEGCQKQGFYYLKRVLQSIEGLIALTRSIAFKYSNSELNEIESEHMFKLRLTKVLRPFFDWVNGKNEHGVVEKQQSFCDRQKLRNPHRCVRQVYQEKGVDHYF